MQSDPDITELLEAADSGDPTAFQQLYDRTYNELRRLAHHVRAPGHQTLSTTALVHEAYLKLVPGEGLLARDRVHFFRIAARAMRQVLVDAARRRATRERGNAMLGGEAAMATSVRLSAEVLDLENALGELESLSPRQAEVVECRFYGGLSVEETAAALGVSSPTVKRDWRIARAWLAQTLDARTPRATST